MGDTTWVRYRGSSSQVFCGFPASILPSVCHGSPRSTPGAQGLNHRFDRSTRTINPAWWLGHPSEKYEFVNWDDNIPNIWGKKIQTPNQLNS